MVRKADHEKAPVARWATLRRRERRWEASDVLRRLEAAGEPISESYLRAIEGGSKKPSAHVLAALQDLYGDTAPDMAKEPRPEWAEALQQSVDAIQSVVSSNAAELAALRAILEASRGLVPRSRDDQEDGPSHVRPGNRRGR